jgi:hypothetical protein
MSQSTVSESEFYPFHREDVHNQASPACGCPSCQTLGHFIHAMAKPTPPGWNKTIDDLFEEMERGERLFLSGDEGNWARDYERSLLPPGTVFPQGDQIWEVVNDCDVNIHYIFAAPVSNSGRGRLASGERVQIMQGGIDPKPIVVSFLPLRYNELHASLVPPDVCDAPRYTNYALSVKTAHFNRHFRLVEEVA